MNLDQAIHKYAAKQMEKTSADTAAQKVFGKPSSANMKQLRALAKQKGKPVSQLKGSDFPLMPKDFAGKKESAGMGCKKASLDAAAQRGAALAKAAMADPTFVPIAQDMAKTALSAPVNPVNSILMQAGGLALGAGLIGAANVGMGAIAKAYQSLTEGRDKAQAFSEMMSSHKQLGQEDKRKVQQAFNTLYRFNPEAARDPLTSGSFVQKAVDYGAVTTDEVGKIIKSRKELREAEIKESPFGGGIGFGGLQTGQMFTTGM